MLSDQLTPLQKQIDAAGLLDCSSLLNIPTGNGKTWLSGVAIRRTLASGHRAAFLCPLRALARELAQAWSVWDEARTRGIGAFTGELGIDDASGPSSPAEVGLGIFTPEKFDAYLRAWQRNLGWLAEIDLVVVDELHLLAEGRRGATLEGVIARFRQINPYARIMTMSATLGNPGDLADWLDATPFVSRERSIPVTWRIATFKADAKAQVAKAGMVADEVGDVVARGGQSIVFCQSRPRTESVAAILRERGLRAEPHHAGLPRRQRERAEAGFRARELDVLVATPTLSMGVNLPARQVVLHDLQRFEGGEWADLPVNDVWQLAGRAGRPGLDDAGEVILIAPKHNQKAARRYCEGKFEAIRSQFGVGSNLHEQVLALVGSRVGRTRGQVERILAGSLYARQEPDAARRVMRALNEMQAAGMLAEERGMLRATPLGYVAVRHQLTPRTVVRWQSFADRLGDRASFMDVLIACAASPDTEVRLRAQQGDLTVICDALNVEPMAARAIPLDEWPALFGQDNGREIVGAAKTALALRAWTRLGDLDEAAAMVGEDPHAIDEARKSMVRMLTALRSVVLLGRPADTPLPEEPDLGERLAALTAMVATGLDERNATLALIDGIGPKLARRLLAAGFEDIEDLATASADEVGAIEGISPRRAAQWVAAAGDLIGAGGAYRYREVARFAQEVGAGNAAVDYYRWRRAADLKVEACGEGFVVTGGAVPHRVAAGGDACDCADAAKGNLCKHRIAVRHRLEDPSIPPFAVPFPPPAEDAPMTLAGLWNRIRGGAL